MSHRLTIESPIKDKGLAQQVLRAQNIQFVAETTRNRIKLSDPRYAVRGMDTYIDLDKGEIVGDSDRIRDLGELRQAYSEAKIMADAIANGDEIVSRSKTADGKVIIRILTAGRSEA
jgi:hypothetical protein